MGDRTRPVPSVQAFNETLAAPKFDVVVVYQLLSPCDGVGIVLPYELLSGAKVVAHQLQNRRGRQDLYEARC
jgi:hypothetical protein